MDSKRIVGGIVTFAALALAGEWIVRAADVILALFYQGGEVDWQAVRAALGLGALPIGLFYLLRPGGATRSAELERISAAVQNVQFEMAAFKGEGRKGIFGEIASLYLSMDKLGIATPTLDGPAEMETVFKQADSFLSGIGPMIRDGHLRDARHEAPRLIKAIGARPSRPPRTWGRLLGRGVVSEVN